MDVVSSIKAKLEELGEDYESLKPFMKAHLEAVETLLTEKEAVRDSAIAALKEADFSLSSISKQLKMSRTTLYNHEQLLKRYIELSAAKANSKDPLAMISKLQEEKSAMQKEINALMLHDLNFEILRVDNKHLKRELTDKNKEIERLSKQVEELQKKLMRVQN